MACRLFRKSRLLTRPPRRAKTRRSAGKAATPWLTLVSRFTPHVSRFLGATRPACAKRFGGGRERRWRTLSTACC